MSASGLLVIMIKHVRDLEQVRSEFKRLLAAITIQMDLERAGDGVEEPHLVILATFCITVSHIKLIGVMQINLIMRVDVNLLPPCFHLMRWPQNSHSKGVLSNSGLLELFGINYVWVFEAWLLRLFRAQCYLDY